MIATKEHSGTVHWGGVHNPRIDPVRGVTVHSTPTQLLPAAVDVFTADYRLHKNLISAAITAPNTLLPRCYLRITPPDRPVPLNSSSSMAAVANTFYSRALDQLTSLQTQTDEDGDPVVEEGAISLASEMLGQLRKLEYAPPELSWHGGDAVVMLWSSADTTFAITVTDNEWGYVARRDGKQVRAADSLTFSRLALEDLR